MPEAQPFPGSSAASPPPRPRGSGCGCLLGMSLLLNFLFLVILAGLVFIELKLAKMEDDSDRLTERFHSGNTSAKDKIAVIEVEGVIFEGAIDYPKKQIKQAAEDDQVKAIVLRIESPGGSITASDELHRRITELVKGKGDHPAKPAVVSMGSLAASGGYYVAMPCPKIYAERTTLTGSIGVFASFPNVHELCENIGVKMEVIKDTGSPLKDSGSPFKKMSPQERQLWQDMVDHAYDQFLEVVSNGRPKIKDVLKDPVIEKTTKDKEGKVVPFVRTRVDGGIFTADQAEKFGLIDKIGYLEDAIKDVATTAGLGSDYQAITYERPKTLPELLFGVHSPQPGMQLDASKLSSAATPRLWYLSPQSELAGILTAAGK